MTPNTTILITGSSRGLGRALAAHYAERGMTVYGCSRGHSDFRHDRYHHLVADVNDERAVCGLFGDIAADCQVDVLINSAGLALSRLALLTASGEAEEVLRTNVVGAFVVLREAIKHMKRTRRGRIVNFSSINVPLGSVGGAIYNASKAALENLALTLSREIAADDITINTIGLSVVAGTGMAEGLGDKVLKEKQAALIKPGLIDVAEVAHAVNFFAADEARAITNQIVYFGGVR